MEERVLGEHWPVTRSHSEPVAWPAAKEPKIVHDMPKVHEHDEKQPWPAMEFSKKEEKSWPAASNQAQVSWPTSGNMPESTGPIALPAPAPAPEESGNATPWASPSLQDLIDVITGIEDRQPEADEFEPHGDVKAPVTYNPFAE